METCCRLSRLTDRQGKKAEGEEEEVEEEEEQKKASWSQKDGSGEKGGSDEIR